MLDASDSRLLRDWRNAVEKQISETSDSIALGGLADHGAYLRQCGIVKGMRDALAIMADIEKRLNGDG